MALDAVLSIETIEEYASLLGPGQGSADALLAWMSACLYLYNLSSLKDEQLRALGTSVLKSRLKAGGYSVLPGIFLKAKRNGLSEAEALRSIVHVLDSGGGFLQLEDELTRREKR